MYTYTGTNGEHLMHVPSRDLSTDEFNALAPELQEAVKMAAFYQKSVPAAVKPAPKATAIEAPAVKDDGK